jgi:site-specific recombinase XerD
MWPVDVAGVKRSQYNSQGCYFDGLVKGQWIKRTPLSDATVTVIDNYLETRTDDCDSLFINKQNKPMTTDRIRDAVKQCGQYAGLERVTPRLLRHTFATHFTDRHGTILCAAVMGHASTKSTKVYAHLSPRHFRPLMNRHPFIFGALKK